MTIIVSVEYHGLLFDAQCLPGHPGQISGPPDKCYPPEPAEVDLSFDSVEDWDEFAEEFGANGNRPLIARSVNHIAARIMNWPDLYDEIADQALEQAYSIRVGKDYR